MASSSENISCLSQLIALQSGIFKEVEVIQECLTKTRAPIFNDTLKTITKLSLTRHVLTESVNYIFSDLRDQLKSFDIEFKLCSTTNISNTSKLLIQGCNLIVVVVKQLLELIQMHGTTSGEYIFHEFEKVGFL
jgi:hypothetical protein